MIVLLSGRALALATAIWEKQGPECSSLRAFQAVMLWVYDRVTMDSFEAAIASALQRDAALNPALTMAAAADPDAPSLDAAALDVPIPSEPGSPDAAVPDAPIPREPGNPDAASPS